MTQFRFTSRIANGVTVAFADKPPDAIRSMMKANGFRWSPAASAWYRRSAKGAADFLGALERKCNPGRPDGDCWGCNNPAGFFRNQGAAAPVYCNECWTKLNTPAERAAHSPYVDATDLAYEDACRAACGL
jgi:hypothetical protein